MGYSDSFNSFVYGASSPAHGGDVSMPAACRVECEFDELTPSPIPGWENIWIDLGGEG